MSTILLTISSFNALLLRVADLPETLILLIFSVGLIITAFVARRWQKRAKKTIKELAEIHLSQHGGNVKIGN